MTTEYGITRRVFEAEGFVPITAAEYSAAKVAKAGLVVALGVEEKFNLLVENYAEFEQYLLSRSLRGVVFSDRNWSDAIDELFQVNRRLVNVLSTCRLYLDQVKHDLNTIYGDESPQTAAVKKKASVEYDSRVGYRAMEALRNYIQHRSLPVQGTGHSGQRRGGTDVFVHVMDANLDVEQLAEDPEFKKPVLADLRKLGSKPSIKPLLRDYIAGLGTVHQLVRDLLKSDLSTWDDLMQQIADQYQSATGATDLIGLAIVARDENRVHFEHLEIFGEISQRRRFLATKNRYTLHYGCHFVTNE